MIRVEHLTKYYGERLAVDDISFNIEKGEIVGLLGPNAAGKTTTMRMLTGFLMPTKGNAFIDDCNMMTNSLEGRRLIGYMPESTPLYMDMTVRDYLSFLGRLRGLSAKYAKTRVDDVVTLCNLEEYVDVILGKLSRGFKQRVNVAQSIIHNPKVLILDEPTVGIDPIQVAQTRNLIKELGKEHTVLISTHILPEVSVICNRVIIIHRGKIVAEDKIENLSAVLKGGRRIKVEVKGPADKIADKLLGLPGVKRVMREGNYYILETSADNDPRPRITETIVRNGWSLLSIDTIEMSLEEIFLQLTTTEGTEND
ncbi:MAG: ATP-binding cassette domain-containing protein [Dehalococcoidales bacterium]|nr:ATP-binding cassette domain-containing protein [Dehalococcoidales bacterium]